MIQAFYNIDVKDNDEAYHPTSAQCLDRDWYFVKLCNNSVFTAEAQNNSYVTRTNVVCFTNRT